MTTPHISPHVPSLLTRLAWSVPALLIALRFALGPLLFLNAADGTTTRWFLAGLVVAFLSDIFDGVLARRMGRVSVQLREADGLTDVWFYAWLAASAWYSHRAVIIDAALPIMLMLGAQLLAWLIDWRKYRRFSTYHAYTAKLWGITLFIAMVALFGFDTGGSYFWVAAIAGLLCTTMTEELAHCVRIDRPLSPIVPLLITGSPREQIQDMVTSGRYQRHALLRVTALLRSEGAIP